MAILVFKFLLLSMYFTIQNGSRRSFKDVYRPYGPRLCTNVGRESKRAVVFVTEDLTCRVNTIDDSEIRKFPSLSNCSVPSVPNFSQENVLRTNNFTMFDLSAGQEFCDTYLEDVTLANHQPHSSTGTRPNGKIQSDMSNCTILLHQACKEGDLCMVKYILSNNLTDINCRNKLRSTPVITASGHGQTDIFNFLVDQGCELPGVDENNSTVLHVACMSGNINIVRRLVVDKKYNVESKARWGFTPVMLSVYFSRLKVLEFLAGQNFNLATVDVYGNNILHTACVRGNLDIVKYILAKGFIDTDSRGECGWTPLMKASSAGHLAVVKFLIHKGCNIRAVDHYKNNVIHRACIGGHVQVVKCILSEQIIDIDSRGRYGRTPLMLASLVGPLATVKYLMSKGCTITLVDDFKDTALHLACVGGQTDVVDYFLSNQLVDIERRGQYRRTPVMMAAQHGEIAVVKLLLRKGCDMRAVDGNHDSVLHMACAGGKIEMVKFILSKQMIDKENRGHNGLTPALLASLSGHVEIVELLFGEGCDARAVDDLNNNILHLACIGGKVDMVKYILSMKIIDKDSRGFHGRTSVILSAYHGHKDVLDLLVRENCNLTLTDNDGANILHLACRGGDVDVVKYILANQIIDIESRGKLGEICVTEAAFKGHVSIVKLLMTNGADMKVVDNYNNTILHVACIGGKIEMVRYILGLQVLDIDGKGKYGRTPVMTAVCKGHIGIVKFLKSKGCNLGALDDDRNNILHVACRFGHLGIVKYLVKLGVPEMNQRNKNGRTPLQTAKLNNRTQVFLYLNL